MTRITFAKIACVLALSPLLAGCSSLLDTITGPGKSDVEYRVTGTATRVSLRYESESGTAEAGGTPLPWSFTRQAKDNDALYVSATITEGDGTVTAAIYVKGKLVNSSTSTGVGAIATASRDSN